MAFSLLRGMVGEALVGRLALTGVVGPVRAGKKAREWA